MEVLQIISECPCSLFQEVRFGLHIPFNTVFPSSLAVDSLKVITLVTPLPMAKKASDSLS